MRQAAAVMAAICAIYSAAAFESPFFHEVVCTNYQPEVFDSLGRKCIELAYPGLKVPNFGCSTVVKGNLFGRNYDWTLGTVDECLLRVPARPGRHASLGVASRGSLDVIKSFGLDVTDEDREKCLPYLTMDGVNDAGVAISCHFVSLSDVGGTTGTLAKAAVHLPCSRFVRAVLDGCDSARAVTNLAFTVNLYALPGYELQWLVADRSGESYAIGVVSNRVTVIPRAKILVNYSLAAVEAGGRLPPFSSGMERQARVMEVLPRVRSAADMADLLRTLFYSNYVMDGNALAWWSEMNGTENEFTARYRDSPAIFYHDDTNDFAQAAAARLETFKKEGAELKAGWEALRRTGRRPTSTESWVTLHSCVYDLERLSVDVRVLESGPSYHFTLRD